MWITLAFLWISLLISGKLDGTGPRTYPVSKAGGPNPLKEDILWQN